MEADKVEESTHLLQTPTSRSEECNLLLLQEYVRDISHAQQILEQTSASLQRTEILTGIISDQDIRALRTACLCLRSLRIRVEASANTMERAVIEQQLQFMQTRVQPCTTEDLRTTDTSCPSRTSADHFTWHIRLYWQALRLQACTNAIELAIMANSIALDTSLEATRTYLTVRFPFRPQQYRCQCAKCNPSDVSEILQSSPTAEVSTQVVDLGPCLHGFHSQWGWTSCIPQSRPTPRALVNFSRSMMIGKALLSGFWECPECPKMLDITSHPRSFSPPVSLLSRHFSCYTALSLLATRCFVVSCYACMACSMRSRGSWLGGSLVAA